MEIAFYGNAVKDIQRPEGEYENQVRIVLEDGTTILLFDGQKLIQRKEQKHEQEEE